MTVSGEQRIIAAVALGQATVVVLGERAPVLDVRHRALIGTDLTADAAARTPRAVRQVAGPCTRVGVHRGLGERGVVPSHPPVPTSSSAANSPAGEDQRLPDPAEPTEEGAGPAKLPSPINSSKTTSKPRSTG
jgi:hypothetical protein